MQTTSTGAIPASSPQNDLHRDEIEPDQNWKASSDRITQALTNAQSLQFAHLGELDNASSFERLKRFGQGAFQSPQDVTAFHDLLQQHPEQFKDLKTWSDDAAQKSAWAHQRMLDDPFERTPDLPAAPQDYTQIHVDDLHDGNADSAALARYTDATRGIVDNEQMYHAASQRGPIEQEYLKQHTPPKPLWQQQAEDGIGRFLVGSIPGVNLFTNQIVPANSLSPAWRQGLDLMSGVAGGLMGGAGAAAGGRAAAAFGAEVSDPMGLGGSEFIGWLAGRLGKRRTVETELSATPTLTKLTARPTPQAGAMRIKGETPSATPGAPTSVEKNGTNTAASFTSNSLASVRDVHPVTPSGELHADRDHPGILRDDKGRSYIRQNGTTYQAGYDNANHTWWVRAKQSQPVRLDEHGNWQTHRDLRLPGGSPTKYTEQKGFEAYFDHLLGSTEKSLARKFGVGPTASSKWGEKYAESRSLPIPRGGRYNDLDGSFYYHGLQIGKSVESIADDQAGGNIFRVYQAAMKWATSRRLDTTPVTQSMARFFAERHVDIPVLSESRSLAAGRSAPSDLEAGPSTSDTSRSIATDGSLRGPGLHPSQRPHPVPAPPPPPPRPTRNVAAPGPSGSRPHATLPATSTGAQDANRWQRMFHAFLGRGDKPLNDAAVNDIDEWINHVDVPTPPGLTLEVQRVSNGAWTAEDLRDYLHERRGRLVRADKMTGISKWLGM